MASDQLPRASRYARLPNADHSVTLEYILWPTQVQAAIFESGKTHEERDTSGCETLESGATKTTSRNGTGLIAAAPLAGSGGSLGPPLRG